MARVVHVASLGGGMALLLWVWLVGLPTAEASPGGGWYEGLRDRAAAKGLIVGGWSTFTFGALLQAGSMGVICGADARSGMFGPVGDETCRGQLAWVALPVVGSFVTTARGDLGAGAQRAGWVMSSLSVAVEAAGLGMAAAGHARWGEATRPHGWTSVGAWGRPDGAGVTVFGRF
jgi:hypothetical protein